MQTGAPWWRETIDCQVSRLLCFIPPSIFIRRVKRWEPSYILDLRNSLQMEFTDDVPAHTPNEWKCCWEVYLTFRKPWWQMPANEFIVECTFLSLEELMCHCQPRTVSYTIPHAFVIVFSTERWNKHNLLISAGVWKGPGIPLEAAVVLWVWGKKLSCLIMTTHPLFKKLHQIIHHHS